MANLMQHHPLLQQIVALLRPNPAVRALLVVGSVARGTADRWSDLDIIVVIADGTRAAFDPAARWIAALGEICATEHYPGMDRATTRAWLSAGRLDLVLATETCFARESDWPLWDGVAVAFSRSMIIDQVVQQTHLRPEAGLLAPEQFEALVNQFWFQALASLTKVVRGDLLIGLHLCLEVVQGACVLAMALRDRATGTSIHTTGGVGNSVAQQLHLPQPNPSVASILDCLEQTARTFDQRALDWSPDYRPRLPAFAAWLADAQDAEGVHHDR
jgi:predicted nucleotidyltransferase